jgi:HrpA-like RNA helicase
MSKPLLFKPGFIKEDKEAVPINYIMKEIVKMRTKNQRILILKSATGTGKSTVLPVYLYNSNRAKNMFVIEPRVLSVMTLSKRICQQESFDENFPKFKIGKNVGFYTRAFFRLPTEKGIIFTSFGTFINQLETETDASLCESYSYIVVDEAHDMELFSSNVYKKLRDFVRRNKTKDFCPIIIFMSATIDRKHFSKYFDNAPTIKVSGESFEITKHFLKYDTENYMQTCGEIIEKIHNAGDPGNILVFFPGVGEISAFMTYFEKNFKLKGRVLLVPLYRKIANDSADTLMLISKSEKELKIDRKVILATNIGETAITYTGLKHVIDTGLYKSVEYIYDLHSNVIYNKAISTLSMKQRRGRVGRTSTGEYWALYSEETANLIKKQLNNNLYKEDISLNLLHLLHAEPEINLSDLDLIYDPSVTALWRAVEKLYLLGFLTSNMKLTEMGAVAAKLKDISVEQIKMVLAGFAWKAPILDLITVAVFINFPLAKIPRNSIFAQEAQCDLIAPVELLYNGELQKHMGADYEVFMELRDSLIDSLAVLGLDPFLNYEKCFPNTDGHYIKTMKQCMYEAYKMNSAFWNGTDFTTQCGNKIYKKFPCHVNSFIYTKMFATATENGTLSYRPEYVSILDNFVNYTADFF